MTTSALGAFGAVLTWNSQPIAEIINISGPKITIETKDVTSHSSPSSFKEFIPGLADGGEVSIEGNFIPGDTNGQIAFINDAVARMARTAVITLPTAAATSWTFTGIITSLEFTAPHDDKLGFSATIKITGVPVKGVTASAGMSALTGIEENAGAALTFLPAFAIGTFIYTTTVNTNSDWVKLTPTAAAHTITITVGGADSVVASGAQSGELALGAAGTVTTITIKVQESDHVAKTYTLHVSRP